MIRLFKDKSYPMQVSVTSVKISSTSINHQRNCAEVCFVDVPSNVQSVQQAGGRMVRIGQESALWSTAAKSSIPDQRPLGFQNKIQISRTNPIAFEG